MAWQRLENGHPRRRRPYRNGTPIRAVAKRSLSSKVLRALLAAQAIGTFARAEAQDSGLLTWMGRDAIIGAFVDRQLSGVYPSGVPWTELVRRDGTSDYREGQQRREGRWWMSGDHFCFAYALPQSGGCFQVVQVGKNCYELYAVGSSGGVQAPPDRAQRSWNGRMWREDEAATCQETPST